MGGTVVAFRAVLAGCGSMARGWVKALTEQPILMGRVDLVGLVDVYLPAAEALRDSFGLTHATVGTDLAAVLGATKPDLLFDVVIPDARQQVVSTGLAMGCHVLSEKPMATSLPDARDLIALSAETGNIHAVLQNRRYNPGVRRIRRLIDSGALGSLTAIHADFFIGAHFGGFREQMQHVLLVDMAIHTFDAARFMSAKSPLAVYAHETNPVGSWNAHGAAANAIFEMSDGVIFTYRGSWVAEGAPTNWDASWRIIGTKGTLLWDGADQFEARVLAGDDGFLRPLEPLDVPPPEHANQTLGHASVIAAFLTALEAGQTPETVGDDNIKSLAMVFGAIQSATTRSRIELTA
jgi:predicted dehydrogenase